MDTTELLHNVPLFASLGPAERDDLLRRAKSRTLEPLEPLFWVGDAGHELFIVIRGDIEVCIPDTSGKEIRIAVVGPGEILGEVALLDGGPRSATARAVGRAQLLSISREDFHDCILRFPSVAMAALGVLGKRQRQTVEKLRGIRNLNEVIAVQLTPWQRIANLIANIAASPGFLLAHAAGFGGWIALNLLLGERAPDPFPFMFLCFWASVEAIFLSLFILVSQATQSSRDRIRNELEYHAALKLQLEINQLHAKLDRALDSPNPT